MAYDDNTVASVTSAAGGRVGSVRGDWSVIKADRIVGRLRKTGPGHCVIEMGGKAIGHVEHFNIYLGDLHVGYLDGDTGAVFAGEQGQFSDHVHVGHVEMKVSILHRAGAAGLLLLRSADGSLAHPEYSRPIRR